MRWVFYALLIINLAYGGWKIAVWSMQPTSRTSLAVNQSEELNAPVILKVVEAVSQPVAPAVPPVSTPANLCTSLGPWADAASANAAIATLGDQAANARVTQLVVQKQGLSWVYLPAFVSREEALKVLKDLQRRGVDSFITNDGTADNAISLGFFSSHDSALGLQQRIRQLGYEAQVRETPKDLTEYWLYLPDVMPDALLSYLNQHPELVTGRVDCQATGINQTSQSVTPAP